MPACLNKKDKTFLDSGHTSGGTGCPALFGWATSPPYSRCALRYAGQNRPRNYCQFGSVSARLCKTLPRAKGGTPPNPQPFTFNRQPPQCHALRSLRSLRLSIRFAPCRNQSLYPRHTHRKPHQKSNLNKPNHT